MKTCWLCREPLPETFNPVKDDNCPSCLTIIGPTGKASDDPGMLNVGIALARAMDRLTSRLATQEKNEKLDSIAKKLGFL